AKNTTVVELGLLPAEVVAFPGNGVLSCSLGRYAVDLAETAQPCQVQAFLDDLSTNSLNSGALRGNEGCEDAANCDACTDIDKNETGDDKLYISP
ncbi:unnamed protein product, partial [Pylaiella littoralis]